MRWAADRQERRAHEPPSTRAIVLNFVGYELGWLACVLGAARAHPAWGAAAALAVVLVGLLFAPRPAALWRILLLGGIVGLCWDSALLALGLVAYAPGPLTPPWAPPWILALWLLLAGTLGVSLRWLQHRLALAALLGAIAAPLAYLAGARLGALSLPKGSAGLWAQSAGWALLLPALLAMARRLDV